VEEKIMARVRDLTEIINNRRTRVYISEAFNAGWRWKGFDRSEADALSPRLRRLAREERARRYGVRLSCAFD
jgi:hypothetical protein